MRIAYVCADRGIPLDGTKGAAIHVRAVATALRRRGHHVPILTARPNNETNPNALADVHDIGYDRTLKSIKHSMGAANEGAVIAREINSLLLNLRTSELLEELGRQTPFDAIYERYSLWSWAGMRYARQQRIPFFLEVNAPLVEEQKTFRHLQLQSTAEAIELELLRHADTIIVPADELVGYIEGRIGKRRRTIVSPNCADLELFAKPPTLPDSKTAALRGRFVIVFVGSLKPWHGIEVLLKAFDSLGQKLPKAHLLIVGDGPLQSAVKEHADRWGPARVTCTGAVSQAEVAAWLALADVGVAPYPALPNFYFSPLKVIEYQAAGLPVVASCIGQLRQQIQPGHNGFLVTPGDPHELAHKLHDLAGNPKLAARLGRHAQRRARRFDWNRTAGQLEKLIEKSRGRSWRETAASTPTGSFGLTTSVR